jgi:hypothetical protein
MNPAETRLAMDERRPGLVRHSSRRMACRLHWVPWLTLLVVSACGGRFASPQLQSTPRTTVIDPGRGSASDADINSVGNSADIIFRERRLRQLIAAQHKAMVSDTDKLLKLVIQFNAEIDNSTPAALTPEQLRMVAEIEKLAHSVKDKMRTSAPEVPGFVDDAPRLRRR